MATTIGTYTPPMPRSRNRLLDLEGNTLVVPEGDWSEEDIREAAKGISGWAPRNPEPPRKSTASWVDREGKTQTWESEAPTVASSARRYKQLTGDSLVEARAKRQKAQAQAEADAEARRKTDAEIAKAKAMSDIKLSETKAQTDERIREAAGLAGVPLSPEKQAELDARNRRMTIEDEYNRVKLAAAKRAASQAELESEPEYQTFQGLYERAKQGDPDAIEQLSGADIATLTRNKVNLSAIRALSPAEKFDMARQRNPSIQRGMDSVYSEIGQAMDDGVLEGGEVDAINAKIEEATSQAPASVQDEFRNRLIAQAQIRTGSAIGRDPNEPRNKALRYLYRAGNAIDLFGEDLSEVRKRAGRTARERIGNRLISRPTTTTASGTEL